MGLCFSCLGETEADSHPLLAKPPPDSRLSNFAAASSDLHPTLADPSKTGRRKSSSFKVRFAVPDSSTTTSSTPADFSLPSPPDYSASSARAHLHSPADSFGSLPSSTSFTSSSSSSSSVSGLYTPSPHASSSSPAAASSSSDMAADDDSQKDPAFSNLTKRTKLTVRGKKTKIHSSTTSTMMLQSTLTSPDVNQLIRCLALALYTHLQSAHENNPTPSMLEIKESAIFDEVQNRLWTEPGLTDVNFPSVESIYKFIHAIFEVERLSHECAILCLAYIERMMRNSHVRLRANTWRRIVLGALILASKVWEDQAVWNVDFLAVFPAVTVKDLGRLEAKYLNLLHFSVGLKASTYAKYYFELRKHFVSEDDFPLKPLDKDGQRHLEERSRSEQDRVKSKAEGSASRSHSVDFGVSPKSPPAVLN